MKPMQDQFKLAKVFYNDDGEFGQQVGWVMTVPYLAEHGGMSGMTKRVTDWEKQAILITGNARAITQGKLITTKAKHGANLLVYRNRLYRLK